MWTILFQSRRKTSQMANLEQQLDQKMTEFSATVARMKQLEEEVVSKEDEANRYQKELHEKNQALQKVRTSTDQNQQLQREQFNEYEKQIDIVSLICTISVEKIFF